MSDWFNIARNRRDDGTVRAIWAAIALSLLVHVLLLWGMPRMRLPSLEKLEWGDAASLSVNLVPPSPPPAPPPQLSHQTQPSAALPARSQVAARPQAAPPVAVRDRSVPDNSPSAPAVASGVAPPPLQPSPGGDLSSYIEAQRRARATPAPPALRGGDADSPPVEGDTARSDRIVTANLGAQRAPAFGYDPSRKGGAFQIQRVGYNDAEFIFYGWNKELRRNMAQLVEVQRGSLGDIRLAVVRRVIAIIRDFESGDFLWESGRQGHNLMLSARPSDNAALEEFMMHEFFGDPRLQR